MPGVEPGTIAQQHPGRTTTSQYRLRDSQGQLQPVVRRSARHHSTQEAGHQGRWCHQYPHPGGDQVELKKGETEKKRNNEVSLQWTVAHITMQCSGRINTKD